MTDLVKENILKWKH